MAEFCTLAESIERCVHDGISVAMEGFTHLIPHAAAHEVIRQQRRGLTLIRMTPDMIYDQLIGMGCAAKMIFAYAGNPGVGLLHRLRDAVQIGWPNKVELEEYSHAAMANAYAAGASGLPFGVLRGHVETQLSNVNPRIKSIICPYTGEVLVTVPAINPDVAIIHAQKANRRGDILIEGVLGVQKEALLAAGASVVTVEEVVKDFAGVHPNACVLPHWTVTYIAEVPGGAHPSYAQGYYRRDNTYYKEWDAISRDRETFLAWMRKNVIQQNPAAFALRRRDNKGDNEIGL